MIRNLFKRITAGALSALTLLTSAPLAGAVDSGIMPLAEEDNKASAITINVGEVYNIADRGVHKAWFQQNGARVMSGPCLPPLRRHGDPRILRRSQQG